MDNQEIINWRPALQPPDTDRDVLIQQEHPIEPVWIGHYDTGTKHWHYADGGTIAPLKVLRWAEMPKGVGP